MSFEYNNGIITVDPQQTGFEYKKWGPLFTVPNNSVYRGKNHGDIQQKYMIMNRMPFCNYPLRDAIPDCDMVKRRFPSHIDQRGVAYENNKM